MWMIGLKCDGCGDPLAWCDVFPDDRVRWIREELESQAESMGWERVISPDDGKQWFCATCRRARAGVGLIEAAIGGGEGDRGR